MARKKKVTKNSTEQKITTAQSHPLVYQGKVKIQVARGTKILSSKTYTNNGLPNLFKYISHALAGSYYPSLRPCKIKVLKYDRVGSDAKTPTTFMWETDKQDLVEISPYIAYDATPIVKTTVNSYATVFRFKIPFDWLFARTFNIIGLYSEANGECAYFLFTKPDAETEGLVVWDTQNLGDETGNDSLIIEWTMEVSNK